jgi:beta-phosphoglucomutase-like phosphatase (HAD superfamily)
MTATLEAVPGALPSSEGSRTASAPQRTRVASRAAKLELFSSQSTLELDTVATLWQRALDAAGTAVSAAGGRSGLSTAELRRRSRSLATERQETATLLARLAAVTGIHPAPWLSAVPITRPMLGLGDSVRACLFDLDGVLTNSDVLHASAWAEVFDDFLLRQSHTSGWHFTPFDVEGDYGSYVGGRTRLEGIHAFLESRGLHVPEGRPGDSRERDTAYGLAKRKSEALARGLQRHTVEPPPNARRYLEAAGRVGIARVVVSASASTTMILESAGLATVVDAFLDADVIRAESLRSPPAPDMLLAALRRVGVQPGDAVAFTESPAELAAARTAGIDVVGIAEGTKRDGLIGCGAQRTSPSLASLLDSRLLEARP